MRPFLATLIAMSASTLLWCCTASSTANSAERVQTMQRVSKTQPANLTRNSVVINGAGAVPFVLTAYAINGDAQYGGTGTIQPGVALFNGNSAALVTDRQINVPPNGNYTVATSGAGHDAPSLIPVSGGVMVVYGAISTYASYKPPAAWACGFAPACQPFKFAASTGDARTVLDALADSPERLLPTVGISEVSYASIGNTTLIGGQQQPSLKTSPAGVQGYVAFDGSGGGGTFETGSGPWNFASGKPSSSGLYVPATTPGDDAYVAFGIVNASAGPGSARISIGDNSCTVSIQSSGDAARAAADIAAGFPRSCSSLGRGLGAMQVTFDPTMVVQGRPLVPAEVGITAASGKDALPPASAVRVVCDGAIACASPRGPDTVLDERASGLHRHFLFGGLIKRGAHVYYLMDVEQLTGSWYARGQSSLGLALACLRVDGKTSNGWRWTDCAGRNPFEVAPGETAVDRLRGGRYLIPAPGSYRDGMTPYVYDFSMSAQARTTTTPVVAAVSLTEMPDGNLMFVHGCQSRDKAFTVCYARFDPRSGRTLSAGTIAAPSGAGSLTSVAARTRNDGTVEAGVLTGIGGRWGCGAPGLCFLTYRYDASGDRWIPLGKASIGGNDSAAFPGTIEVDGDRFVVQMHRLNASGNYDIEVQMRA